MHTASINTSNCCAGVLFSANPIVERISVMLRVSLLLYVLPTAFSIIVRDPPPSPNDYKYSYNIEDPTTGDSKSQHEVRQGDVVTGAYTVLGPDGTKRTVEYTADAKHGFKATIREDPVSQPVTQPPISHARPPYVARHYAEVLPADYSQRLLLQHPPLRDAAEHSNYIEDPAVYFTPQNEVEPRIPFDGHYFIPAGKY